MDLPPTLKSHFLRRDNRFRVTITLAGRQVAAHLPNSGRLGELLVPGRECYLVHRPEIHRRTAYDLLLVDYQGILVSVDARLPNRLFAEAVTTGQLAPFIDFATLEPEVRYGESRLDFRLNSQTGICWVETKSVTLVKDSLALFPDAPTLRGQRHLRELTSLAEAGQRAAVVFVIQRPDAAAFSSHTKADPAFAIALAKAAAAGVMVHAFRCDVTASEISISDEVPVALPSVTEP